MLLVDKLKPKTLTLFLGIKSIQNNHILFQEKQVSIKELILIFCFEK